MPQLLLLELKEVLLNWKLKSKRKNLIKRKMKSKVYYFFYFSDKKFLSRTSSVRKNKKK